MWVNPDGDPMTVDQVMAAATQEIGVLHREREELLRELALAESLIESQQRQLVAAGVLDPELGP